MGVILALASITGLLFVVLIGYDFISTRKRNKKKYVIKISKKIRKAIITIGKTIIAIGKTIITIGITIFEKIIEIS